MTTGTSAALPRLHINPNPDFKRAIRPSLVRVASGKRQTLTPSLSLLIIFFMADKCAVPLLTGIAFTEVSSLLKTQLAKSVSLARKNVGGFRKTPQKSGSIKLW